MIDKDFYKNSGPFSLHDLAKNLKAEFVGDGGKVIDDIAAIDCALNNEITFFNNNKYEKDFKKSNAGAIIVGKKFNSDSSRNLLIFDDAYLGMARVSSLFYPDCDYQDFYFDQSNKSNQFHNSTKCQESSFVHKNAIIGKNCTIGSYSKIGPGVKIGDGCIIGDNVSIYFSKISENVKIYQGVKIGGEGFGFIAKENIFKKIPQLGRVIIRKNVEIGCNTTIDRGSIGDTIILENTMIDNMVHIGHNVKIGKNCIIAAMTGISGSTEIGSHVIMGGQVGISGHLKIGDNVKIAAKSGVMKNISDNSSVGGYPAENILDWHRTTITNRKLKDESKKRT